MKESVCSCIPVIFSVDECWLPYVGVAIYSLCRKTNPEMLYDIWIIGAGFSFPMMEEMKKITKKFKHVRLKFKMLGNAILNILSGKDLNGVTQSTYYRLWLGTLFPEYKRVVYLDADVLLNADVAELFNMDLEGKLIGAATDISVLKCMSQKSGSSNPNTEFLKKMGVQDMNQYFNAGVLVLDLEGIRNQGMEAILMNLLNQKTFFNHDQDILNIAFYGLRKPLPPEWNFQFEPYLEEMPDSSEWVGTEFGDLYRVHDERSWKVLHLIETKPWDFWHKIPANVTHGRVWWRQALAAPAFKKHLEWVLMEVCKHARLCLFMHQWKMIFSFGRVRTRRRKRAELWKRYKEMLNHEITEYGSLGRWRD